MNFTPIELGASIIFAIAVLHTFCTSYFEALAKLTPPAATTSSTFTTDSIGTTTNIEGVSITPTGTYGIAPLPGPSPIASPIQEPPQQQESKGGRADDYKDAVM